MTEQELYAAIDRMKCDDQYKRVLREGIKAGNPNVRFAVVGVASMQSRETADKS